MPSINEVIERVAAVRPDAYEDKTKAAWLIELDGKLFREVILRHRLTAGMRIRGPVKVCPECGGYGPEKPEPEEGEETAEERERLHGGRHGHKGHGHHHGKHPARPGYNPAMDFSFCPLCGWTELPKPVEKFPEDGDLPLLVSGPHDRLYDLYLMAQIDFYNREYENYNNSVTAFNTALDEWRQSYHRTHLPLPSGNYRNLM